MGAPARVGILALLLGASAGLSAVEPGSPAPDFSLPSIHSGGAARGPSSGGTAAPTKDTLIRLSDYRGSVVYVDFWSAWCAPCRESLARLAALREEQPRGRFEILSVNVDALADDGRQVLASIPVAYPVARDALQVTVERFGVEVLPAGVLIDADGIVRGIWQGPSALDLAGLKRSLHLLIPGGAEAE